MGGLPSGEALDRDFWRKPGMMNQDLRKKYYELARISAGMQEREWRQIPPITLLTFVIDYLIDKLEIERGEDD